MYPPPMPFEGGGGELEKGWVIPSFTLIIIIIIIIINPFFLPQYGLGTMLNKNKECS